VDEGAVCGAVWAGAALDELAGAAVTGCVLPEVGWDGAVLAATGVPPIPLEGALARTGGVAVDELFAGLDAGAPAVAAGSVLAIVGVLGAGDAANPGFDEVVTIPGLAAAGLVVCVGVTALAVVTGAGVPAGAETGLATGAMLVTLGAEGTLAPDAAAAIGTWDCGAKLGVAP
jgi:hypothetical protein